MKAKKYMALILFFIILTGMTACTGNSPSNFTSGPVSESESALPSQEEENVIGQIYLYGERHAEDIILEKELELWYDYYHNDGMRHLFLELSYFTAEFLNIWMQSDDDEILDMVYYEWRGTLSYTPSVKEFYRQIKSNCPETIFHGTDVGHQYFSTGKSYLEYLAQNNLADSTFYVLAQEAIDQGRHYITQSDEIYRENKMAENFIREFDALAGESIMGIYGAGHTRLDTMDSTNSVPCMGNQLQEHYGNIIYSEDLSLIVPLIEPTTDSITINDREYAALYYGTQDMSWSEDYSFREFWYLENAYDDFKDMVKTVYVIPYDNYPMPVEAGQVFVIDDTKKDGSVIRMYYRSDGNEWDGLLITEGFTIPESNPENITSEE